MPEDTKQADGQQLMISGRIDSSCEKADAETNAQIHLLFEAQARKTPQAIAVVCGRELLTYRQLNERANQLARYLRKCQVGPDMPVALYLERSLDMVVAILGVLKAGAAYLPLDPVYPKERLGFILADAQAPVLLTQRSLADSLPAHRAKVVCVDSDWERIALEPAEDLPSLATADNTAYIIYTSGSTGMPKGVLVTHKNVVRLFTSTRVWYDFKSSDVWTLFHSYAFDFSVWEIWGALFYGGRLVVVPYLVSRSPSAFYELLAREEVTVLNQTPSAFRQLIWAEAGAYVGHLLSIRYVIFGGEALELQSLRPWFEAHGDEVPLLVNMYGITETTVHVTYRPIKMRDVIAGRGSVIGQPIPDLQLYLLDEAMQPVAPCMPGEIYVGGAGVARGYLNRPELTRERFIADPFSSEPGARLYRSGDLARRLPDGELEYLGRADQQIKIHGFRIELGEIEAVLNQHPSVRESVVEAHVAGDGDKRLVAYVVAKSNTEGPAGKLPNVPDLRDHLGRKLPAYMIPAAFVFLDSMPLTANGKVDRKQLPQPDGARPALNEKFAAASSPAEQALEAIWSEVLEVSPVGVNDNFFELGGDSIRAITLLSRSRARGLDFSLQELFAHPTIAGLVECVKNAPPKAALAPTAPFSLISEADRAKLPADAEDAYPMIQLQTGMFYYNELNPASAVYHDVFSFQFHLGFDKDAFEGALRALLRRHPVFKTSFHIGGFSEPMQVVRKEAPLALSVEDVSSLPEAEQINALDGYIAAEKRVPFDRTIAPLIRFHAQIQSAKSFQFIVSFHHVCMDGWSLAELVREVLEDYFAMREGGTERTPAPRLAYRDFVALERKSIASEPDRQFWTDQLRDVPAQVLPRWPKEMRAGGLEQNRGPEIIIPSATFDGLRRVAREAGVPLKSVLLSAHQFVMGFLQGQSDVVSGLVCNGRPEEQDGEKVMGLFLNTLPVRLNLEGGSWMDLVKATFAVEQAIIPHRRFPLAEIQKLKGGAPVFESAFDFVHFHVYKHLCGEGRGFLEGHYFEANNLATLTTFMLDVTSTQLQMHIDYDPNLLSLAQVKELSQYYCATLEAMAADPQSRYEALTPFSAAERTRILEEWNATQSPYAIERSVHELFEEQARRNPDAPAVNCGNERLSYGELDRRAGGLAARLSAAGAGPGTRVGCCVGRSARSVVALLGILKTGAAYVPLDPTYPRERLAYMMGDAQMPLIVTEPEAAASLPEGTPTLMVEGETAQAIRREPGRPPGDALAYVIYTSGSTGQPKGVQIKHRSVVNLLTSMAQTIGFNAQDHLLAVTTFAFDIAGLEIFLPLICGGQVTIAPSETTGDGLKLRGLLESSGATVMQATPITWRMLIEAGWAGSPKLKILCGGEAMSRSLADALLPRGAGVWNVYGPTETTIWSTAWKVTPGASCFIGRPLANTQIYILDARLKPVPAEVTGRLFIGGDGLALGYWNRPEMTTEKFIPNPLTPSANARIYDTGDLARFRPDGVIECMGRSDFQIKLRGFRIEPGEIEAALRRHPQIKEALVMAREDQPGEPRLAAYLLTHPGAQQPPAAELRQFALKALPAHMAPACFVFLEDYPRTPAGKIDRRSLPSPEAAPRPEPSYAAPRTPLENEVAAIWREVFHVEKVGLDDNFFALGGHSLTAVRVIVRVRERFGVELPLAGLFSAPTVRGLAEQLLNLILSDEENSEFGRLAREVADLTDEQARQLLEMEQNGAGGV